MNRLLLSSCVDTGISSTRSKKTMLRRTQDSRHNCPKSSLIPLLKRRKFSLRRFSESTLSNLPSPAFYKNEGNHILPLYKGEVEGILTSPLLIFSTLFWQGHVKRLFLLHFLSGGDSRVKCWQKQFVEILFIPHCSEGVAIPAFEGCKR